MKLEELSQFINIEIAQSLSDRFMDSEQLYVRFLKKLLTTTDFGELEKAAAAGDWQETLRRAHNLKGVCANLGLNELSRNFANIVDLIRSADFTDEQIKVSLAQAKVLWEQTLVAIGALEA